MTDYTTLSDEQLSQSKEAIEAEIERRGRPFGDEITCRAIALIGKHYGPTRSSDGKILLGDGPARVEAIKNGLGNQHWEVRVVRAALLETKALQERVAKLEAQLEAGPVMRPPAPPKPFEIDDPQPDDGWIEHDGGPCPVPDDTTVSVRLYRDDIYHGVASDAVHWPGITHYRIVKGQDDE